MDELIKLKLTVNQTSRPQQRSEDDVGSLHIHQVIIKIIIHIIAVLIPTADQATPQTANLFLQMIWASDTLLTDRTEGEKNACNLPP